MKARKTSKKQFFDLAERLDKATIERLTRELASLTFGS
jgi:hypothetical protein